MWFGLVAGAIAVLWAGSSRAQAGLVTPPKDEPAPPLTPTITMPVLKKDEGAVYPAQAIKDKVRDPVTVMLVLELDASGAVKKVVVETPAGHGFDEAAVEAAWKLEFEPAKKNGQSVASKIRHKYEFAPPTSRLVGTVRTQPGDKPLAGATITVTAENGTTLKATATENGHWQLDGVLAAKYTVTILAEGYGAQVYEQSLDPGEEATIDVRLARQAPPPPPGSEDIEEVEVRGQRPAREVTKRTLEQRELARIPGTNGDALRAIQNLPGVARPPGIAGLLIVRGASPNETSTYVDGTLVPMIYHFGGLSSVIPTEMLDKIDFYPGNFSSMYGRVTGAIVDVGVHDPVVKSDHQIHGLAQVDLIDARVLAQGPIGNTGWNFAIAGRRSYVDLWLKPVLKASDAGVTTAPVYYDYQAMLQREWDHGKQNFRLLFLGSDDRLAILIKSVNGSDPGATGNITFGTAFYRLQARYVGKFSNDTEFRLTAAIGKDAVDFSIGDNYFRLTSWPITPRAELSQRIASGVRNNFGLDIYYAPYTADVRMPPIPQGGQPPPGPFGSQPPRQLSNTSAVYRPAIYDEVELTPFRGTRIVPGVRLDYAKDTGAWDVQPRFVARQELRSEFPKTTLKGGIGRFTQPPQIQETNSVFGTPGLHSNIANQYGFGVEQEVTKLIDFSTEAFYRQYDQLVVQNVGNVGSGHAYGLETLVRYKPDAHFFGFLAYTLSRSVRRDLPTDPERLFEYDQTHILTAVGSYRLGGGWEVGARFRLISGNMQTPQTYGFYDATIGAYMPITSYPPSSVRNPMFHQLDVRIDKTWIHSWGRLGMYLDIQNIYNQGNVEGISYNYNSTLHTYATGLPILPSLGIRAEM
ncbi:MAG: TonB family protein [Polyangiaceae bacterium]|nr:TonB family protein [Polyangiaceae bacterium]